MITSASDLIGTWALEVCEVSSSRGDILHPLGQEPRGLLAYTPTGHMLVAIQQAGREAFETQDILAGGVEEKARAAETYVSYAGTYRVERGRVYHHVEVSLFPNWVGAVQPRIARREGERLELSTDPMVLGGETRVARMMWRHL